MLAQRYQNIAKADRRWVCYERDVHQLTEVREAIAIFVHTLPNPQPLMDLMDVPRHEKLEKTDIDARYRAAGKVQQLRLAWLKSNRELLRSFA